MKIHEYQAVELLRAYGVPTGTGSAAETPEEARAIAEELGGSCVVKAQIHSGGRGKAGGVKVARSPEEAEQITREMLGKTLATKQSGPEGKVVNSVYVVATADIAQEYYFSIMVKNNIAGLFLIASQSGGMDIEAVAAERPEAIIRMPVSLITGYREYTGRELARRIGMPKNLWKEFAALVGGMVRLFLEKDCSLIELNPLAATTDGKLLALDAKMDFDDNAIYRHPELSALRDPRQEDPKEVKASRFNLNYISLSGNIGCLVNGAGLAMATMDTILKFGGSPANFLDVRGGASKEMVKAAFEILLADTHVQAIFVNIFGGIMKCDIIAEGVVEAAREMDIKVPLIIRLEGTNVELGKEILAKSGLDVITAEDMAEGAKEAVARANSFAQANEFTHAAAYAKEAGK